jgi:hypothetical protein
MPEFTKLHPTLSNQAEDDALLPLHEMLSLDTAYRNRLADMIDILVALAEAQSKRSRITVSFTEERGDATAALRWSLRFSQRVHAHDRKIAAMLTGLQEFMQLRITQ